jgi:hypothetical protein
LGLTTFNTFFNENFIYFIQLLAIYPLVFINEFVSHDFFILKLIAFGVIIVQVQKSFIKTKIKN